MIEKPLKHVLTLVALAAIPTLSHAGTVAYWNFDEGTAGQSFANNSADDLSGNGNAILGFNTQYAPIYSTSTASGSGLSLETENGFAPGSLGDGYTGGAPVNAWSPQQWTIEVTVALDNVGGWKTVLGRDGSSFGGPLSDFYLQRADATNSWRVDFSTVGNQRVTINSTMAPVAGTYYQLAVTSDGSNARFFVNDLSGNAGYVESGTAVPLTGDAAQNALASNGAAWTLGRGWFGGGFVDNINGRIDNVRFSDTALSSSEFLAVPEPSSALIGGLGLLCILRRRRA
ncbi:MAG: LamG-like jellyroll fold domain-containing protein [Verrucomicrobiota bacterium]